MFPITFNLGKEGSGFGFFCTCGNLLSKASEVVQVIGIERSHICCWRHFEGKFEGSVGDVKNFHGGYGDWNGMITHSTCFFCWKDLREPFGAQILP